MPDYRIPSELGLRLAQVQAISFDGDGTLWDFESAMLQGLATVLDELQRRRPGPAAEALTVGALRALRDTAAAEMPGASLEEIRLESMHRAVRAASEGDPEEGALAQALYALYMSERYAALRLCADARTALEALAPRYPLAVISNGNTDVVRAGLRIPFAAVVFAADVGYAKPDPRIFFRACRLLDCPDEALLHVGDTLETDVAGAQAAGVLAVWLRRGGRRAGGASPGAGTRPPDLTIRSLDELVQLMDRCGR